MLFQSLEFILIFLPVVLAGYFLIGRFYTGDCPLCNFWLIGASLIFYGRFHLLFPVLLVGSALITYGFSVLIKRAEDAPGKRRALRTLGVVLQLAVLFLYKYYDFFVGQINAVTGSRIGVLALLLPVGLSFTTFQQIAFLVDCERVEAGLTEYLTYITFFPKLVQGPITLPDEFLPQLREVSKRKFSVDHLTEGLLLFIIGLSKKVLLADVLAPVVRFGYEHTYYLDTLSIVLLLLSYAFQLYFDFTGYCDMAQGVARMMNIDLPDNFHSPFQARSIKALWQRWHMSLSRFFTRYVYIPLGGSRRGRTRTLVNVMIVFVLSAIWHGAGWTFLAWGVLEGAFVVVQEIICRRADNTGEQSPVSIKPDTKGRSPVLPVVATNALFCLGLIFFNAQDMTYAFTMLRRLFVPLFPGFLYRIATQLSFSEIYLPAQAVTRLVPQYENVFYLGLWLLLLAISIVILRRRRAKEIIASLNMNKKTALCFGVLFAWSLASLSGVGEFLYFAF